MCVCVCVCVYINIHTRTHTHTHTQVQELLHKVEAQERELRQYRYKTEELNAASGEAAKKFSKVLYMVTLHGKYTRALTFSEYPPRPPPMRSC